MRETGTVEIHYTLEPAVHETSSSMRSRSVLGEEQIRVHRSNFWLGTIPKQPFLLKRLSTKHDIGSAPL